MAPASVLAKMSMPRNQQGVSLSPRHWCLCSVANKEGSHRVLGPSLIPAPKRTPPKALPAVLWEDSLGLVKEEPAGDWQRLSLTKAESGSRELSCWLAPNLGSWPWTCPWPTLSDFSKNPAESAKQKYPHSNAYLPPPHQITPVCL